MAYYERIYLYYNFNSSSKWVLEQVSEAIYKSAQSSTTVDLGTEACVTFFASVVRQKPANSERRNYLNVGVV